MFSIKNYLFVCLDVRVMLMKIIYLTHFVFTFNMQNIITSKNIFKLIIIINTRVSTKYDYKNVITTNPTIL